MAFITLGKLFGKTVKIAVNPTNNQPGDIILQLDAGNSDSINLSNVKDTSGTNTGDQTITLSNDASGTGTTSIPVTITSVGSSSAANIHTAELAANSATNTNTVSKIVKRDSSGNFSAGTITATLSGAATTLTGLTSSITELNYTDGVTSSIQPQIDGKMDYVTPGTSGNVLTSNGTIWTSAPASGSTPVWGTITGTLSNQTDLQSALNAKQNTLTLGNLTDAGTDGITVTGGSGAVVGSGTSISQHIADSTHNGYLSSTDWSTFNSKGSGTVTSVSVATANGLAGSSSGGATPSLTLSTTITGILNGNGAAISAASSGDFPTLNQNTTGSAAKWTTARNLAGNNVDGSTDVAFANKFIVQGTVDTGLSNAQFLGSLGTGIVKNTTSTGVLSIAIAGDFPTLNQNTTGNAATATAPQTGSAHGAVTLDSSSHFQSVAPGAAGGYLRSDGTDFVRNTIQVSDVPTLNQNTTGTAADLSATLIVAHGGTGSTSLTANNVILGNGTGAVQFVAPGTSGNVLTSNGTTWNSAPSSSSGMLGSNWDNSLTFSPSAGFGTPTDVNFVSRRVGDSLEVNASFTTGTVAASPAYIDLPMGYTIDTSKFTATTAVTLVGRGHSLPNASSQLYDSFVGQTLYYDGNDNSKVYMAYLATSRAYTVANGNTLANSGDAVSLQFTIPITGWSWNS